ncbi:MAG TPA: hypothetical protein VIK28_00375 [Sedimentisphaerales bacterium]
MTNPQDIVVLEKLTEVLEKLHIAYCLGGSMASSVYGTVRFTQDADITVEPFEPTAEKLFETLKADFYISSDTMYQALKNRGSFNIIHFATAFKIDVFIQTDNDFQKQMLSRGRKLRLGNGDKEVSFVSPEDIILLKLDWFRQSGCASQRQWSDVQGVLTGQAKSLDFEYLKNWAKKLGLAELLVKAISESKT